MSATATASPAVAQADCAHCGAPLIDDQEWCLECGTARTLIHRAPDWRVPLVIVSAVVMLVLAGAAFALVSLSADANRSARAPVAKTTAATPPATASSSPTSTPARAPAASPTPTSTPAPAPTASIPDWPLGLGGWTVALGSSRTAATADALATKLAAARISVGVLESSQHASLIPGFWVVFSGRYPTGLEARAAADRLKAAGHPQAHPRLVAPPGGQ